MTDLDTYRTRPQSSELELSVFQPRSILACRISDVAIARGARVITFDTVSLGDWSSVESGMTLWVGTTPGSKDVGKIRIKSATSSTLVVSENSHINWQNLLYLTVLRYWEVFPIYPRIITDPTNDEDVIFYKDYDITYTNQNSILGAFVCAGSHKAGWVGDSFYFSASGTSHVIPGTVMTYDWAFEGGSSITGSTSHTPGNVTYNTPGHYVTRLIVTGDNGSVDTSYRYISIYNKPENSAVSNPVKNWQYGGFNGSRGEGGHRGSVGIVNENIIIDDGSVVVMFGDDWYGSTNQSLGGNAVGGSKIFFVGHVLTNTIHFNSVYSSYNFDIGTISEMMKVTETYAISLEPAIYPTKWFQVSNMNSQKAIYHYLKFHSTSLFLADFQFVGQDQNIQFFDTDRQSVFDAVDNYMRNTLVGTLVCDRQGKLWAEVGAEMYDNPTGSFPTIMNVTRGDWMSEPTIERALADTVSSLEVGGVAYSGSSTGTFDAFLCQAPGATPNGRGVPENIPGLAVTSQSQLNTVGGHIYATKNAKFSSIEMPMANNFRNLDIAPLKAVGMDILPADNSQGFEIHAPYLVDRVDWSYDVGKRMSLPTVGFTALVNGIPAETIDIPEIPDDGGFGGGGGSNYNPISFPAIVPINVATNPTYTWVINLPTVGGIPGTRINVPHTAMRLDAYCVGGDFVTLNIESRTVIGTPGIDLCTSEVTAANWGQSGGSIANPVLSVGSWLWLDLSGVYGTVSKLVVNLAVA